MQQMLLYGGHIKHLHIIDWLRERQDKNLIFTMNNLVVKH
jgi:hypothetical protein